MTEHGLLELGGHPANEPVLTQIEPATRRSGKVFSTLLCASADGLRHRIATELCVEDLTPERRMGGAAVRLGLGKAQLVCAFGFNPAVQGLSLELAALGYPSYDELARHRNQVYTTDVYDELSLADVQSVYRRARAEPHGRAILQYLLPQRLTQIESRIDATVDPTLIDRYQRELRYFYFSGIAQPEFVEVRLSQGSAGFRALCDELELLLQSTPVAGTCLLEHPALGPAEKWRLIERGLVAAPHGTPFSAGDAAGGALDFETSMVLGAH